MQAQVAVTVYDFNVAAHNAARWSSLFIAWG